MTGAPSAEDLESSLPGGWLSEESIWQLVECCGYSADLPTWSAICGSGSVLDIGCGIGRVGHHLGESGAEVIGVDRDREMVGDFNRRAPEGCRAVEGDALDPSLSPGAFESVIAPQQLIQIVGGPEQRASLLGLIARSLAPGGTAALAITENLPEISSQPVLTPDLREFDDWVFSSRPVALEAADDDVTVRRFRQKIAPDGELTETTDSISFARVSRASLRPEAMAAGLRLAEVVDIAPTDAHMASAILVFRRA